MNNEQDLASMSGETTYQSVRLPVLDEIGINGNDGKFYVKRKTLPKEKVVDEFGETKETYPKEALGKTVELVWLKLRRQLIEKTNEGVVRQTNEHNTKTDVVSIYHYNGQATEHGILASEINGDDGLYPKMKVHQLVYAMDIATGHLYKLVIKGGSLSMQERPKEATLFYGYISSMGKDEHFYTMTNVMTSTIYKTSLGAKYYADFTKGRVLTEEEKATVKENMTRLHAIITEYDKSKVTVKADPINATSTAPLVEGKGMELPDIDYGDTGVDVDDIPF